MKRLILAAAAAAAIATPAAAQASSHGYVYAAQAACAPWAKKLQTAEAVLLFARSEHGQARVNDESGAYKLMSVDIGEISEVEEGVHFPNGLARPVSKVITGFLRMEKATLDASKDARSRVAKLLVALDLDRLTYASRAVQRAERQLGFTVCPGAKL